LAHAGRLAETLSLDLVATGWVPTAENYLGRVTKARILEAVREAKGEQAAQRIEPLKKGDIAVEAERLLAGTGWLPEPLRTAGVTACFAGRQKPFRIRGVRWFNRRSTKNLLKSPALCWAFSLEALAGWFRRASVSEVAGGQGSA
jgi:hypothetical protein